MINNPYSGIIRELRGRVEARSVPIGRVISASPLQVAYRGLTFDADDIYISPELTAAVNDMVYVAEAAGKIIVVCKITEVSE